MVISSLSSQTDLSNFTCGQSTESLTGSGISNRIAAFIVRIYECSQPFHLLISTGKTLLRKVLLSRPGSWVFAMKNVEMGREEKKTSDPWAESWNFVEEVAG